MCILRAGIGATDFWLRPGIEASKERSKREPSADFRRILEHLNPEGADMPFLKRLLSMKRNDSPKRVRICIECGMPIAEHKEWCSILRGQNEMKLEGITLPRDES